MPDAGKDAEGITPVAGYSRHWDSAIIPANLSGDELSNRNGHYVSRYEAELALNALQQQVADAHETIKNQDERNAIYQRLAHEAYGELADVRQERDRYREAGRELRSAMESVRIRSEDKTRETDGKDWLAQNLHAVSSGACAAYDAALTPGAKGETDGE